MEKCCYQWVGGYNVVYLMGRWVQCCYQWVGGYNIVYLMGGWVQCRLPDG